MNTEKMNQIIDEAYENYITQIRIEFEKWCQQNPGALVNYREDTKELFLKSIKEDKHWFSGEKKFSERWGLKIEERELSINERIKLAEKNTEIIPNFDSHFGDDEEVHLVLDTWSIPTKLITITYKDEKIEVYE